MSQLLIGLVYVALRLNGQRRPDEGEQGRVKIDGAIGIEGHIHRYQTLKRETGWSGGAWQIRGSPVPAGGKIASRTLSGTRFQIFWTMDFSSRLQVSMGPSILILREVLMTAKRVAVKVTVPSGFSGMFMATNRCNSQAQARS